MKVMPATKSLNQKKKAQSALKMLQNNTKKEVVRKPRRTRLRPRSHDEGTTILTLQQKAEKKKMKRKKDGSGKQRRGRDENRGKHEDEKDNNQSRKDKDRKKGKKENKGD